MHFPSGNTWSCGWPTKAEAHVARVLQVRKSCSCIVDIGVPLLRWTLLLQAMQGPKRSTTAQVASDSRFTLFCTCPPGVILLHIHENLSMALTKPGLQP